MGETVSHLELMWIRVQARARGYSIPVLREYGLEAGRVAHQI
ncbi:hypothetical protein [Roseobacter sp. S98]